MGLAIFLLGAPRVEHDGAPGSGSRGNKPWGLLAYLFRAERPPSRDQLVSLLFAEADDPFATLRWNLSALRRLLPEATIEGDPVRLALPAGTIVDIETLISGSPREALRLPGIGQELLAGMHFDTSPAFETWLMMERRHLAAAAEAVLREAALTRLASADPEGAATLAARLVGLNPYDENFQVLLVRSLAASGDRIAAARQAARCTELFELELGVPPSPALAAAARTLTADSISAPRRGRAAARAQLEAGEAAIRAGSVDAGLECLRRAATDAYETGDVELRARALLALGSSLVHAARGRDEEAATALYEIVAIAQQHDLGVLGAAAARELGYVEFLRGRYDRAHRWLRRAQPLAADHVGELARIGSVLGSILTDTAHYPESIDALTEARRQADQAGDGREAVYAHTMLGRAHLLRGNLDEAARILDESLALADRANWTAFMPWPESLRGDADLGLGDVERASERYEHAFALGCQIGDPCWEGVSARGLALVAVARGNDDEALTWFEEARRRCLRLPDAYLWVDVYTLDGLCAHAIDLHLESAEALVDELALMAARTGMRELLVRAHLHHARLGDDAALVAAQTLADEIDSPALARLCR
jgi:DNA-binding SARP family transcriptional activator